MPAVESMVGVLGCARLKLAATHVVVCGLVWPPSLSHVVV